MAVVSSSNDVIREILKAFGLTGSYTKVEILIEVNEPVRITTHGFLEIEDERVLTIGNEIVRATDAYKLVPDHTETENRLAHDFLSKLAKQGGRVISSADATQEEIIWANANNRMFIDNSGLGYIIQGKRTDDETNKF